MLVVAVSLAFVTACTSESPGPTGKNTPSVALRVTTVPEADLTEHARARFESEVSDVLARYVQTGFLGNYPRSDFVASFQDFTSGAAEQAVGDIDVLTAARFEGASAVRATDLAATLSFYVVDGQAVGATAWIDFTFGVEAGATPRTVELGGRLVMDRRDDQWSVFAYDVHRHDSDARPTEASS